MWRGSSKSSELLRLTLRERDRHGPARYFKRLTAKRVQRILEMTQNREGGHLTVERG